MNAGIEIKIIFLPSLFLIQNDIFIQQINKKQCDALIDFIAFLITLFVPGYLLIEKHFSGLEKWALSVFLSLSVTSFLYYVVISFFGISREFIYAYALILLVIFFVIKKPDFNKIIALIRGINLKRTEVNKQNIPELCILLILVFSLALTLFFIPINKTIDYDDSAYHLPIIFDIADDGKKTFFAETKNIYEVRSNQFPLLFESFTGTTKFFVDSDLFWFVSFFSFVLSLFLIYFISRFVGYSEFFSLSLYALSPIALYFSRYFGVESFMSLFFLGCVFFILNYIKSQNNFFIIISGFLAGLMFLTKFTGAIFFVGLLFFLLYKRKFKGVILFGLLFVLVSSVFLVSHLNVPVEQVSVGEYGTISADFLTQSLSNVLRVCEIFLYFFSHNYYIFFIPLLLILGVFWRSKREKDFSFLLAVLLFLFLFVTFINGAYPTLSGFPRYFLPIYSLLCIFSGIQLKKIILFKDKRAGVFVSVLFLVLICFTFVPVMKDFYLTVANHSDVQPKIIENNSNVSIWFINGAALQLKADKATLYDYAWQPGFSEEPCDFLKKNKITYIVYFHIDKAPYGLGDFGLNLKKDLLNGTCAEVFSETHDSLNSVTFKIIYK